MGLTKQTITDKIESVRVQDHYYIQVREKISVMENESELSSSFHRYVLNPDHDVSKITDDVVKDQFEAVMTQEVKDNYAKFLKEREDRFLKEQAERNKGS